MVFQVNRPFGLFRWEGGGTDGTLKYTSAQYDDPHVQKPTLPVLVKRCGTMAEANDLRDLLNQEYRAWEKQLIEQSAPLLPDESGV